MPSEKYDFDNPNEEKSEILRLNLLKEVVKSYKEDILINVGCYIKKIYERVKIKVQKLKDISFDMKILSKSLKKYATSHIKIINDLVAVTDHIKDFHIERKFLAAILKVSYHLRLLLFLYGIK